MKRVKSLTMMKMMTLVQLICPLLSHHSHQTQMHPNPDPVNGDHRHESEEGENGENVQESEEGENGENDQESEK